MAGIYLYGDTEPRSHMIVCIGWGLCEADVFGV